MPMDVHVYLLLAIAVVHVINCCDYKASLQNTEYGIQDTAIAAVTCASACDLCRNGGQGKLLDDHLNIQVGILYSALHKLNAFYSCYIE